MASEPTTVKVRREVKETVSARKPTPLDQVPPAPRRHPKKIADNGSTAVPGSKEAHSRIHKTFGHPKRSVNFAALMSTAITFSEYPVGTTISAQYQPQGILFGGTGPFISTDGSNPTSPILKPGPGFQGDISGTFVTPSGAPAVVDGFGLDVGYVDNTGSTVVDVFNAAGGFMGRVVAGHGITNVTVSGFGIGSFLVHTISSEAAGYAIDNVAFPTPVSALGLPLGQTIGGGSCNCSGANHQYQWLTDRPVNTATGALTERFVDVSLPSPGIPFEFARSYTSVDTTNGPMGPGWTHPYVASATPDSSGNVLVRAEDGQQLNYLVQSGGDFLTPPGARSTLASAAGGGWVLTEPDQSTLTFDSAGKLVSIHDRLGHGVDLAYSAGVLTTATDSAGRVVNFTHTGGLLTKITLSDGRFVEYSYTGGRLTSVKDMRGKVTTYTYDSGGRLESMTDPLSHQQFFNVYDSVTGRVTQQTDARGKTTTFAWDPLNQRSTRTDPRGKHWVEQYEMNVLRSVTDPLGNKTSYGYDSRLNRTSVTDPRGNVTTMTYDAVGNMLTRQGPAPSSVTESWTYTPFNAVATHTNGRGKTTTYEYYANQLLKKAIDPLNRATTFAWTSAGLLDTLTDPRGKTIDYGYDSAGNGTSILSAEGNLTTFGFDGFGRKTSMVEARGNVAGADPNNYKTLYTYDNNDQLLTVTDPLGHVTTNSYDDAGNLTTVTDADNHETSFEYNANNNVTKVTDPRLAETLTAYDDNGNVTGVTTPAGTTTYTYDDANRRATKVTPRGNVAGATPADFTWTYTYDANGNQLTVANPTAGTGTTAYDERNRPVTLTNPLGKVTTRTYNADDNLVSTTDPLNRTTTNAYDDADQLVTVTDPLGKTTGVGYDASGNRTSMTTPLGNKQTWSFDGERRQVTSVDPRGNVVGGTPSDYTTTNTYDPGGRLLTVTDPLGHATTYTYDRAGNLLTSTDARNNTTTYTYDVLNRLKTVTDPLNNTTTYGYDAAGNLTSRLDANGHSTSYSFDLNGWMTHKATPVGTWNYTYDAAGNLTQTETPLGVSTPATGDGTITQIYDPADRLTGVDYSDTTPDVTYGYNQMRLTSMTDNAVAGAASETYGYDDAGQLTGVTRGTSSFAYSYDNDGRLTSRAVPDGRTITQTWDDDSRVTGVSSAAASTTYSYDAAGNRTGTTFGNGITETRTYDQAGWLSVLNTKRTTSVISGHTFTRDANGNPTKIVRAYPTTQGESYTYDADNRVTQVCWSSNCIPGSTPATKYTYDGTGNRLTEQRIGGAQPGTITSTYNAADQLTQTYKPPYFLTPAITTTFSYDANGNETSRAISNGATTTYTNDLANRTTTATTSGTTTAYTYDGAGNRLSSTTNAISSTYTWDKSYPLPEMTAETVASGTRKYLDDPYGDPIALVNPGTGTGRGTQYMHPNGTGSVAALTDSTNARTATYSYDPFGIARTSPTNQPGGDNPIGFASEFQDTNTGLYNLRARQYDPTTGRFNALDPISQDVNDPYVNEYVYAGNRPSVLSDPSGQCLGPDWLCQPVVDTVTGVKDCGTHILNCGKQIWDNSTDHLGGCAWDYHLSSLNATLSECREAWLDLSTAGAYENVRDNVRGCIGDRHAADCTQTGIDVLLAILPGLCKDLPKRTPELVTTTGWRVGDDVYALTKAGKAPSWSTVRSRFWKNEANNPKISSQWSDANLARMKRGLAPQRYNPDKGGMESMELSHEPVAYRDGGKDFVPRWPCDHAARDPYRHTGYC